MRKLHRIEKRCRYLFSVNESYAITLTMSVLHGNHCTNIEKDAKHHKQSKNPTGVQVQQDSFHVLKFLIDYLSLKMIFKTILIHLATTTFFSHFLRLFTYFLSDFFVVIMLGWNFWAMLWYIHICDESRCLFGEKNILMKIVMIWYFLTDVFAEPIFQL